MQAILVRVLPATNHRRTRMVAQAVAGKLTMPCNGSSAGRQVDSAIAAEALARKLEWEGTFHGGTLPNGDDVYVRGDNVDYPLPGLTFTL